MDSHNKTIDQKIAATMKTKIYGWILHIHEKKTFWLFKTKRTMFFVYSPCSNLLGFETNTFKNFTKREETAFKKWIINSDVTEIIWKQGLAKTML